MSRRILPGDRRLAASHLARAYELDPTLRPSRTPKRISNMTRRRYAYDESGPRLGDLREAHRRLTDAAEALGELLDSDAFRFDDARGHAQAAMDAGADIHKMLGGEAGADGEPDATELEMAAGGVEGIATRRAVGKDAMGETPARSAVTLSGARRDVDHRQDFAPGRDSRRGARDEALPRGYDIDAILQRK
jgi:hypothetical protein